MTDETVVAIASIPLARSLRRVLAVPAVLLLAGGLAAVVGWLLGGVPGLGLAIAGGVLGVIAAYLVLLVLSVRLDLEVSTLRLRRLGSEQRFSLVRGPVTRVPLRGEGAARLRPRFGALGWGLGPARLRDDEQIHLIRLAPTSTAILVPTDSGRVAIAPASEQQLIAALGAAARVQQRLDQVAARARSMPIDRLVQEPAVPAPAPEAPPRQPIEPPRERVLTGIERVLLEERLAAQRAAALAAAEAERQRAAEEALAAAEAARLAAEAAAAEPPAPERRLPRVAMARVSVRRIALPRPSVGVPRPKVKLRAPAGPRRGVVIGYGVAAIPLAAAAVLWGAAAISGRLDLPDSAARLAGLALALGGPAAAVGALAARAWFPRLIGPVLLTALCGLLLTGRALFG
jgi:hypothetical protein